MLQVLSHSSATWCTMTMPLCVVYLLMSIKSGVLDFTIIGMIKKVIHFNGESPSFCDVM